MKTKDQQIAKIIHCPRCDGTGEEPGAPIEEDGSVALCDRCNGNGQLIQRQGECPKCGSLLEYPQ